MNFKKADREAIFFVLIIFLSVYRFSYLWFNYIPYLDDYVQYSFYPSLPNHWETVYKGGTGVLFTRPLAGILDLFLWSGFYEKLGLVVALLSAIYGLSAVFFYKGLRLCGINVGLVFFTFYIFAPLNTEGTYWVSAATRIVPSLFFISLAMFFAAKRKTVLFAVFSFSSVWFYEQTAVLSLVLLTAVCVIKKDYFKISIPALSFLAVCLFYLCFGKLGDNAGRIEGFSIAQILTNFKNTTEDFFDIFITVHTKIIAKGFVRGFNQIARDFSVFWIVIMTALVMCLGIFAGDRNFKLHKKQWIWGIILTVCPLLPFLFLSGSFLNLRNAVPILLGISILLDGLLSLCFKKFSKAVSLMLIFVFIISGVSEITDYSFVAKRDHELAKKIASEISVDTKEVWVKISSPKYYPQNAPFRDHIMSMTGSDWGVTGIVRTISKNRQVKVKELQK